MLLRHVENCCTVKCTAKSSMTKVLYIHCGLISFRLKKCEGLSRASHHLLEDGSDWHLCVKVQLSIVGRSNKYSSFAKTAFTEVETCSCS